MLHRAMCLTPFCPVGMVVALLLYQFIDSIELLQPTLPPTPRLHRVCTGSGLTVKPAPLEAAEAHHGGVVCGL